jgi:hypothetical protein
VRWNARLHEAPVQVMGLALRHHQPVADQPLGPAEIEALAQLPGLADQRLPDHAGVVQYVDGQRPEADADHVAVLPCPLEQRERVAAELQRMPENRLSARHQGDIRHCLPARYSHRPHP